MNVSFSNYLPAENWWASDQQGDDPDDQDHGTGEVFWTSPPGVTDGLGHCEVSVDADGAQAQDGRRAQQDVQGYPHDAKDPSELPRAWNPNKSIKGSRK